MRERVTQEESSLCSSYRVAHASQEATFVFAPRADSTNLCVALASMISKYLREVLMMEFNAFWMSQLPDLKPTAGYPVDARRFFDQIKPLADSLGLEPMQLWRNK